MPSDDRFTLHPATIRAYIRKLEGGSWSRLAINRDLLPQFAAACGPRMQVEPHPDDPLLAIISLRQPEEVS